MAIKSGMYFRTSFGAIVFDDSKKALKAEDDFQAVQAMEIEALGERVEDHDSGGFVQHDVEKVKELIDVCYARICARVDIAKKWPSPEVGSVSGHIVARVDDGPLRPEGRTWNRLGCIDKLGREWNQPYYANNTPNEHFEIKRPS